jgi:hypothetical protein
MTLGTALSLSTLLIVGGCSKPTAQATPAQVRFFQFPTATEVFNLRTKCQQAGEKLDSSLAYGPHWSRQLTTNYRIETGRCYAEVYDTDATTDELIRSLYDAQTRDQLAFAKKRKDTESGMIFMDNNIDTASDCHVGGDCGFAKVNDFINQKMKRDDAK